MDIMKKIAVWVALLGVVAFAAPSTWADENTNPQQLLASAKNKSPQDMRDETAGQINNMKKTLGGALELLESARDDEKDIVKLNCIRDKVAAIKGFLKVSEQSEVKMQDALASKDRATAEHQYALVMIGGSKVSNLGVEVGSCAGEVLSYSGRTDVKFEVPDDIPEIDTTVLIEDIELLFKLPEATPFQ